MATQDAHYATLAQLQPRVALDGYAGATPEQVLLPLLLQAEADINGYCRRDFYLHQGTPTAVVARVQEFILLPQFPLKAVTAMALGGLALTPAEVAALTLESYGRVGGARFTPGQRVEATVTWGFEAAEVPVAVNEACLRLASRKLRLPRIRERIAMGITAETLEGYQLSLKLPDRGMDSDVAALLSPYVARRAAR